jgi:(2Fe-2S) ferredoxin
MPKYEKHIFVCTNQRDPSSPRGCCDPTGKAELQGVFKEKLKGMGLQRRFRANKSGCLDQCEHGPTVVVYPEAVWYGGVRKEDVDEIITSHILGGRPVERLLLAEACINTAECAHRKPKG